MKRILVPTDFSPTAEKALRFALEIATRTKGTIILYHLYTPVERSILHTDKTRSQRNEQAESNLMKRLNRLKKKVTADNEAVLVLTVLGRTPIINNILGFAELNHIDFIVMGTQGASGLRKAIIGSVASRIIKKSDIPVLLVPEKFEWRIPEQILFASDCRQTDMQALPVIYSFAKLFKKGVNVVQLFSAYEIESEKEKIKNGFDNYAYSMQRTFSNYKLKFQLIEAESIIETMKNLDQEWPHDVLAMVRGEKSFFEKYLAKSFTQAMACMSRKPLLIIPEEINIRLSDEKRAITANAGELNFKIKKIKQKVTN